jgi:hypothetical protein
LWLSLFICPAAASAKTKVDQVRPKPKLAANRAPAQEKKGKKGKLAAKADSAKGKNKNQNKQLTVARNQHNQPAANVSGRTAKLKPGKQGQLNTVAKLRAHDAGNQRMTSRLPSASLVPAVFVASERRGKFGKANTTARHDTPANPPRRNEPPSLRQPDQYRELSRNEDREEEPAEPLQARRPREVHGDAEPPAYSIARPDKIEVTEYGSTSPTLSKLLALPDARPLTPFGAIVSKGNSQPVRRNDLVIPQQRVLEIQYELAKRGFYNDEPNGAYDDKTVQAMLEFQKNYGLPATGYPTAHSLKRLGLTSW